MSLLSPFSSSSVPLKLSNSSSDPEFGPATPFTPISRASSPYSDERVAKENEDDDDICQLESLLIKNKAEDKVEEMRRVQRVVNHCEGAVVEGTLLPKLFEPFFRTIVKQIHHLDGQVKEYICLFCGRVMKDHTRMVQHVMGVHFRYNLFVCDKCPSKFYRKADYKKHWSDSHIGIEDKYELETALKQTDSSMFCEWSQLDDLGLILDSNVNKQGSFPSNVLSSSFRLLSLSSLSPPGHSDPGHRTATNHLDTIDLDPVVLMPTTGITNADTITKEITHSPFMTDEDFLDVDLCLPSPTDELDSDWTMIMETGSSEELLFPIEGPSMSIRNILPDVGTRPPAPLSPLFNESHEPPTLNKSPSDSRFCPVTPFTIVSSNPSSYPGDEGAVNNDQSGNSHIRELERVSIRNGVDDKVKEMQRVQQLVNHYENAGVGAAVESILSDEGHWSGHHMETKYRCHKCKKKFTNARNLIRHHQDAHTETHRRAAI
ncbi:hypothetical protein FRC19_010763 [Serendipita sp. 401]|nr:hypothetical protein FRC19_010763 [Serendipita sp. 401]